MKIAEVKQQYKDEWILGLVLKKDELGQPIDIEVISHSKNRDDIHQRMKRERGHTYIFYSGEIPLEGYAVAF